MHRFDPRYPRAMRLLLKADTGGSGGGGDAGGGAAGSSGGSGGGASGSGAGAGSGGQGGAAGAGGGDDGWTPPRNQAEFDQMVGYRLREVRGQFADYDELKKKAGELDKLRDGEKSDLQKAQDAVAALTTERDTAVAALKASTINAAIIAAASKAGAVDPDAVAKLIDKDAVTIDNAGRVTGADTAVKQLLEASPYLKGQAQSGVTSEGLGGGNGSPTGQPSVQTGRDLYASRHPRKSTTTS